MGSSGNNPELRDIREKVGATEVTVASLVVKTDRISEIIDALGKLETRIRVLEERKSQLDDVVAYKTTCDDHVEKLEARIRSLEETKWYYKGGLTTIAVLLFSSGILGVILGIVISKGLFPSASP